VVVDKRLEIYQGSMLSVLDLEDIDSYELLKNRDVVNGFGVTELLIKCIDGRSYNIPINTKNYQEIRTFLNLN